MRKSGPIILIVDDDEAICLLLEKALSLQGYQARSVQRAFEALTIVTTSTVDLVLADLCMPEMDGITLLKRAKASHPDVPFIVMTGNASIDTAVKAMKCGACDYIAKPFDLDEVFVRVQRALKENALSRENRELREELGRGYDVGRGARLIGASEAMTHVLETIAQVSQNRSNVLIQGQTGTGKEVVAKAIHYSGPRARRPFIALNCGSVSKSLLESQLFGHVKGAFTGAVKDTPGFFVAANGGTLLLDEITEIDTETQVRLLRAVQEREVTPVGGTKPVSIDVRIIAATNRDLRQAVEEGVLRQDLYYRLSVVVIELPPLRERRGDIETLVAYFHGRLSEEYGLAPRVISPEAMDALMAYDWPGNVRELENVVERAFALGRGPSIDPDDLPVDILRAAQACLRRASDRQAAESTVLPESCHEAPRAMARDPAGSAQHLPENASQLDEAERALILRALDEAGGNKSRAARTLGVGRNRLYRLLHKHSLLPGKGKLTG